jgi:thioredoxin 1
MPGASRPLVACLCADWCGSCREYRATFDALAAEFEGAADFAWVDVEDDADALGDPDIENFPTLLIARGDRPLFFGTVLPHVQTLSRLVQSATEGNLPGVREAGLEGMPARIRALRPERA